MPIMQVRTAWPGGSPSVTSSAYDSAPITLDRGICVAPALTRAVSRCNDGGVLEEVVALELRLLDPAVRADREAVERLLHPEFREIGASGRLWDRDSMTAALAQDLGTGARASEIDARFVAEDL